MLTDIPPPPPGPLELATELARFADQEPVREEEH